MKVEKGGTLMWCPACKTHSICKAIPAPQVTGEKEDYEQCQYYEKYPDIRCFQRGRRCLSCRHEFVTAEVELYFIDELVDLRDALKEFNEFKKNERLYVLDLKKASYSLDRLLKSADALRTLLQEKGVE